jgi:hypothetical protein
VPLSLSVPDPVSVSVLALHTLQSRRVSPLNYASFNIFQACICVCVLDGVVCVCVCVCKGIDGGLFALVAVCGSST